MKKVYMTFDEYDETLETLSSIPLPDKGPFYPSIEEIEEYGSGKNPDIKDKRLIMMLVYLLEKNPKPDADDEDAIASMDAMKKFVNEHLVLMDSEEEIKEALLDQSTD